MKILLSCLILLATIQSNAHNKTHKENIKVIGEDGKVRSEIITVADGPDTTFGSADISLSTISRKYDTVRVLIVYADTSVGMFVTNFYDGRAYSFPTSINNKPLYWSFGYDVREIGDGYWGYSTATGEKWMPSFKHKKYITENKEDIPKSWIVLPNCTVELK